MKKANNIAIIEPVSCGANEYVVNGVRYTVESRFVPYDIKTSRQRSMIKLKELSEVISYL